LLVFYLNKHKSIDRYRSNWR